MSARPVQAVSGGSTSATATGAAAGPPSYGGSGACMSG